MSECGVNKVIILGNIGVVSEPRITNDGESVLNMSVATSEQWKSKEGSQNNKTEWHRITIFGKLAEVAQQYVQKGSKIYLEGKLRTTKYIGNDGAEKYSTSIIVDSINGVLRFISYKDQTPIQYTADEARRILANQTQQQ
ncbi:MAG: single-stranded DNA-binding protein [Candidatus Endonucleobacter sp. (ex Gigantidas childressi)]|nr:single-stranded DNA-binding protein [Candidatus Endonucleobacter sp. (ex Gigantidas childressi)]